MSANIEISRCPRVNNNASTPYSLLPLQRSEMLIEGSGISLPAPEERYTNTYDKPSSYGRLQDFNETCKIPK